MMSLRIPAESRKRPRVSHGAFTTPHMHQLRSGGNDTSPRRDGDNDEHIIKLADVVIKKSLSIYKASPLFNMSFRKPVLKTLARKISMHIQKVDMWGESEAGGGGSQNLIKVTVDPVVGHREDRQSGILITVTTTSEYGENGDVDQTLVFWGLFCNPASDNSINGVPDRFLDLPLVLVKGRLPLIKEILTFFTKQFDCTIEKFKLAPLELTWLGAMWSGHRTDIPRRPLTLAYATPDEITGIDTITTSIAANDIVKIWKSIHDEASDNFLFNEVTQFTKSLEAHFEKYMKMNFECFTLKIVSVTSLHAESSGKIKLFSPQTSYRILTHILSIIQQEMSV